MTVRPAVNLKSSVKVKGPYKFVYDDRYKHSTKALIYYVLDFSNTAVTTTSGQNYSYTNNNK